VSGLVGYLMSLPSIRQELKLDDISISQREFWPKRMKHLVNTLAAGGFTLEIEKYSPQAIDEAVEDNRFRFAYNGARSCDIITKKRDDIPGDPLPQTTSTVCIQAPLQHLEECRLTIVLVLSRCL
jgi:hypothetical protein